MPIILGRQIMAKGRAMVDMEKEKLKVRVNKDEVTFNVRRIMKQPTDIRVVSIIDCIDEPRRYSFRYLDEF